MSQVLRRSARKFAAVHGRVPNFVSPTGFSDKLFWSKYFRPLKVPEAGNKLLTGTFIPEGLADAIVCPEVIWHSPKPRVPRGGEVAPGIYFLKTSHGSDMYRRLVYPIDDATADALDWDFARNLKYRYGILQGEWWYNAFAPELMLEKSIGEIEWPVSWNFYTFAGEVGMIVAVQKTSAGLCKTWMGPDFAPMPRQDESLGHAEYRLPSALTQQKMLEAARAIGAPFGFVRVDILLDEEERLYLNEMTFTPGNGLNAILPDLDRRLGARWDLAMERKHLIGEARALQVEDMRRLADAALAE